MLIESLVPLRVRLRSGEIHMQPGCPVQFDEADGRKLLDRAPGKVRIVTPEQNPQNGSHRPDSEDIEDNVHMPNQLEPIAIEPAAPNARPVYWERANGIVGPAAPEFLAKVWTGSTASFWVVAEFEGLPVWINSDALRSKQQFQAQAKLKPVELIKEPR